VGRRSGIIHKGEPRDESELRASSGIQNGFKTSSELNSSDAYLLSGKRGEEGDQIDAIDGVIPRKVLST
jgi:hypothetical protein